MRRGLWIAVIMTAGLALAPSGAEAKRAKAAPAPETSVSATQPGDGYTAVIRVVNPSAQGGKLSFTITPKPGFKINPDTQAPLSLHLTPPVGVEPAKRQLGRPDAALSPRSVSFEVAYTRDAARTGALPMPFEATFPLCNAAQCMLIHHKNTLSLPDAAPVSAAPVPTAKPAKAKPKAKDADCAP